MIDFGIEQLFPNFLLHDKNGYAMAKAIEAGLRYGLSVIQTGFETLKDIEKMPEWRLDEMAQELGCLYDYNADIEAKRHWIRDAGPLFSAYGTPQAICNYLEGYFKEVKVEEYWEYGGDPFHFRVWVSGNLTMDKVAWVYKAIAEAKNTRSVMDGMSMGSTGTIHVQGSGRIVAYMPVAYCGEYLAGEWPES